MKVRELIKKLQELNQDQEITCGYIYELTKVNSEKFYYIDSDYTY